MGDERSKITLKNCKNVKTGEITIRRNCLNAKLGLNGTGKSTIAQAIFLQADGSSLEPLSSFEYYANSQSDKLKPEVTSPFTNVRIFNEDYVGSYLFQESSLVGEGFDLIIRTEEMDKKESKIRALVAEMAAQLKSEPLDALLDSFTAFSNLVSPNAKRTTLHGNCKVASGLKEGNALEASKNILPDLHCYFEEGIEKQSNWAKWHVKGEDFLKQDTCPFCGEELSEAEKATLKELDTKLGSKGIGKLNDIFAGFAKIAPHLTSADVQKLESIRTQTAPISDDQKDEIWQVGENVSDILDKVKKLKGFVGAELGLISSNEDIADKLDEYFINDEDLARLSPDSQKIFSDLLQSQLAIKEKANELSYLVKERQVELKKVIEEREHEINSFLESVNYPYIICVSSDSGVALTLRPTIQKDRMLSSAREHLSYGERNALALILFAYSVLYAPKEVDLIVLDDPISSFDADKRYSLIYTLFSPSGSSVMSRTFSEKTVLLLTHDYPLIADLALETVGVLRKKVFSWYLSCNEEGVLSETRIKLSSSLTDKEGLQPFVVMQKRKIRARDKHEFVRISCLRRLLEYEGAAKPGSDLYHAWNVLSQLMHGKSSPTLKGEEEPIDGFPLGNTSTPYGKAKLIIEEYLGDGYIFDYQGLITLATNKRQLLNDYRKLHDPIEKLQICRLAIGEENLEELGLMARYLNETCHVSGDYLFQLDSERFHVIPKKAMDFFDSKMEEIARQS